MDTNTNTWQEPSEATIKAWKEKYKIPSIIVLTLTDRNGEKKKAFFREATLEDLRRARESEDKQRLTFGLSLFNNCWLDGHPDIKTDANLMLSCVLEMDKVQNTAPVEVGNV
jgi:hypothetical protein